MQTYSTGTSAAFNDKINVNGNDNVILQEEGDNKVTIKGSGNEYTSTSGTKEINATGYGNSNKIKKRLELRVFFMYIHLFVFILAINFF